jgi:primosomal protein N' (replication factor Y)
LLGVGTEQAEELLAGMLGPDARVARLDSDIAPGRSSEAVLDRMRSGETNVLVGTQMVTKGHDLPGVSLVGVLLADGSLHFPDFRATERTFQLLTQVAGRAGRGDTEGRVIIQTFGPSHPAIVYAARHDFESFYRFEMAARRELGYPPLARLAAIRLSARKEASVKSSADRLAAYARRLPQVYDGKVRILGPAPAPIAMIRGRYRYRILLQARSRPPLRRVLAQLAEPVDKVKGGVRASFDVDPVHML